MVRYVSKTNLDNVLENVVIKFLLFLERTSVFLIWLYSLVIGTQPPEVMNFSLFLFPSSSVLLFTVSCNVDVSKCFL